MELTALGRNPLKSDRWTIRILQHGSGQASNWSFWARPASTRLTQCQNGGTKQCPHRPPNHRAEHGKCVLHGLSFSIGLSRSDLPLPSLAEPLHPGEGFDPLLLSLVSALTKEPSRTAGACGYPL